MNVQTLVENRLISALIADNAAFTTTLSFLPMFGARSVKTDRLYSEAGRLNVKTNPRLFGGVQ